LLNGLRETLRGEKDVSACAASRLHVVGIFLSVAAILALAGAIVYANEVYAWPTQEEFKSELLLIEKEQPGFVHELLTVQDSGDWWARINAAFSEVDWETWPWQGGAFQRQFDPPGWVEFFDAYEMIPLAAMCALGFAAYRLWRGRGRQPEALIAAQQAA
jgi:hypothetical protein